MDRQTVYRGEIPYETDFLYAQRFSCEALGLLAADLLGTGTLVAGLACNPTGPASLDVLVSPGRIYSQQVLEATAWGVANSVGGLPVDTNTDHKIVKQGLLRATTTLSCPAPVTSGDSINYLIEAAFAENDTQSTVLAFFNASNPAVPWAGPGNSGGSLPILRTDQVVLTVKAGVAAPTGTQTTPAVDSGNVGLWVVTVAEGQTTITSGSISQYSGAPFISETLTQKISTTTGDARYVMGQMLTGTFNATFSGPFSVPQTITIRYTKIIQPSGKGIATLDIPGVDAAAAGSGQSQATSGTGTVQTTPINLLPALATAAGASGWGTASGVLVSNGVVTNAGPTFVIDSTGTIFLFNWATWPNTGNNGWGPFSVTYGVSS